MDLVRELEEERTRKEKEARLRARTQAEVRAEKKKSLEEKGKEREKAHARQYMLEHKAKAASHSVVRQRYASAAAAGARTKSAALSSNSRGAVGGRLKRGSGNDEEPEDDENGRPLKPALNGHKKDSSAGRPALQAEQQQLRRMQKLKRMQAHASVSWDYSDMYGDQWKDGVDEDLSIARELERKKTKLIMQTKQAMERQAIGMPSSSKDRGRPGDAAVPKSKGRGIGVEKDATKALELEAKKQAIRAKMARLNDPKFEAAWRTESQRSPSSIKAQGKKTLSTRDARDVEDIRSSRTAHMYERERERGTRRHDRYPKEQSKPRRRQDEEEVSSDEDGTDSMDDFIASESEGDDDELLRLRAELRRNIMGRRKRSRSHSDDDDDRDDDDDSFDGGFEAIQREEARSAKIAQREDRREQEAEERRRRLKAMRMRK
ncbi:hypothetical protein FVE85_4130 [Porphyridium purpureum]|uniref:Uncharacterized protein n=1 Tax=Porphyridium purpureum TaxID=35688 RepID=A0A5J4YSE1_PORPP|nr:hypothetical protein FVE85_4130 [Porphyridium purpureum]|eukprot:POR6421..scf229_5